MADEMLTLVHDLCVGIVFEDVKHVVQRWYQAFLPHIPLTDAPFVGRL